MNSKIKTEIEKYILEEFKNINHLDETQENYNGAKKDSIQNIKTLVELLQKEDVNNSNSQLENRKIDRDEIKNNNDSKLKSEELKMNSKKDIEMRSDRIIKVIVDGATILVPIIFYNVWMNKGFKFEETGTYTSNTFKNLFSKFKPNK